MKLPGLFKGRGKRKSTDPLGDPFEGLDLDTPDDADPFDTDADDAAAVRPTPSASRSRDDSTDGLDDAATRLAAMAPDGPARSDAMADDPDRRPDADAPIPLEDIELDLDDPHDSRSSAKGLLSRLFGSGRRGEADIGAPSYTPIDTIDNSDGFGPAASSGGRGKMRGLVAAGVGLAVGIGAGVWAWQAGVFGTESSPQALLPPTAAPETAPADREAPGLPAQSAPDRVVMALPPLSEPGTADPTDPQEPDGADTPAIVTDPTAATDRSAARRPWLSPDPAEAPGAPAIAAAEEDPPAAADTPPTLAMPPEPDAPSATADAAAQAQAEAQEEAEGASGPAPAPPGPDTAAASAEPEPEPQPEPEPAPTTDTAAAPSPAPNEDQAATAQATPPPDPAENPWAAMSAGDAGVRAGAGPGQGGVRVRADTPAPEIDVTVVPGVAPRIGDIEPLDEPDAPNPLSEPRPVPSYADLPTAEGTRGNPLPDAPIRGLQASSPYGPIPRRGDDGSAPWTAYAARDDAPPETPRVAIVVHGLGMMAEPMDAAMTRLPPAVTLALTPYAAELPARIGLARAAGHETLVELPMQAAAFPAYDPGPLGLLTLLPESENLDRLRKVMAQGAGYVGLMGGGEDGFANAPEPMKPILEALKDAGLLYLHRGSPSVLIANRDALPPARTVDVVVDRRGFAASIDARLAYLTRVAKARGAAVGVMEATPLGFARLLAWAEGLPDEGVVLAPLSAVVSRTARPDANATAPQEPPTPRSEADPPPGGADHG